MRAATFLVTNTNDSGAGSLRQAILSANASINVPDVINFSIAGTGTQTITPATALPIVTDPVTIDGYTQPGSSANTLTNGDDAVLKIVVNDSIIINTSNSVVRGLSIRNLNLGIMGSLTLGNNVVQGNFIGIDPTGTNSLNGMALLTYIPNNLIGGTTPSARNVISGHANFGGIEMLDSGSGNTVQGNFIGTDNTGTMAIPNGDRAVVSGAAVSFNTIGGTVAGARNVISGNLNRGITLDGSNNVVQGNFIGTDVTGLHPLGNARTGVEIGGPGNLVGGTNSGAGNVIAYNGTDGEGATTNGVDVKPGATGYSILSNSIFDNTGLGIDVNADMLITPGFPTLTVVSNTGSVTVIKGTHTPSITFRLELFTNPTADPSGYGEGKFLLTSTNITTDAGGNFSINWPAPITPGLFVTATADGKTEFSKAFFVTVAGRTNSWTSNASGKWETGSNWSLNVPPFAGLSLVLITNAAAKTVNNDATTASGFPTTLIISNLVISAPGGATNTLLLAHGGTGTPLHILSSLTLNSGGALVVNNAGLSLEGPFGSTYSLDGGLTLNDGLLTVTNAQLYIGNNKSGSLTVSNGMFLSYYPIIGANPGANGTWNIAGGTNIVSTVFDIADSLTATGKVVMTGGQLTTPVCYIGLFGNGTLAVTNGIFSCAGSMDVASQPGAVGNFTAAGGSSTIGSMIIGENSTATGSVVVAGSALVQINGELDERGSILVSGGKLMVTNDNSFLTHVTVSNGTFLARDVFLGNSVFGTFTVGSGGVVALPGSFNGFSVGVNSGTGVVSQVGGQILLTNTDLNVGGLFGAAVGRMTISNGTTVASRAFIGGQGGGNGTLEWDGGTLTASNLQVNSTSQFIFNQGTLQTQLGAVANSVPFQVGDGTHSALYQLLGGTNVFAKGLRISTNGMLSGIGTVTAAVTNFGVIAPGNPFGTINVFGTSGVSLSNSAAFNVVLGSASQFSKLAVSNNASLNGTLNVSLTNGFSPTVGTKFQVLSCANLFGTFSALNVPSGISVTYSNSGVYLNVTNSLPPQLTNPRLSGTNFVFSFSTASNQSYTVFANTNLTTTNWTLYTNFIGDGTVQQIVSPAINPSARFFRVREP